MTARLTPGTALCRRDDLDDPGALEIRLGGERLIVVQTAGEVRCFHNDCPHEGKPLNRSPERFFTADERHLLCGWHGALFEPVSGRCIAGACTGQSLSPVAICLDGEMIRLA